MLKNLFSKTTEIDTFLILDFAQNNLKMLLVSSKYNSQFEHFILAHEVVKHELSLQQILKGEFESIRQEITKRLTKLYKKSAFNIVSCVCGLDDAFFESSFYTSSFQTNPTESIDMGTLQNILQQSHSRTRLSVMKKAQQKFKDANLKLIQSDLIDIRLDNKSVTNPLGLKAASVSVIFFNAFCQEKLYDSLTKLTSYIGFPLSQIYLQPVAQSLISQTNQKALIIELSHSKTSITLAKSGRLLKSKTLKFSTQNIINEYANRFTLTQDQAFDMLINYCNDKFEKEYRDIRKATLITIKKLIQELKQTIVEFKIFDMIDTQIYLMGGGSYIPEVTELLEEELNNYGCTQLCTIKHFKYLSDPQNLISDPGSIALLAYANKFLSDKNKNSESAFSANINQILRLTSHNEV